MKLSEFKQKPVRAADMPDRAVGIVYIPENIEYHGCLVTKMGRRLYIVGSRSGDYMDAWTLSASGGRQGTNDDIEVYLLSEGPLQITLEEK